MSLKIIPILTKHGIEGATNIPEPALELHSRAAPSVEDHQPSDGPDAGRNYRGRQII